MNTIETITAALGPCRRVIHMPTDHYVGRKAVADLKRGDVFAVRHVDLKAVGSWGVVRGVTTHRGKVVVDVEHADGHTAKYVRNPGVLVRVADGSHNEVGSAYCTAVAA